MMGKAKRRVACGRCGRAVGRGGEWGAKLGWLCLDCSENSEHHWHERGRGETGGRRAGQDGSDAGVPAQ